jgi:hypothetical protein
LKSPAKTKEKEARRNHNPTRPQLLPLKAAATYLGLTDWSLREQVWKGNVPFVRFPGGKKMFFHVPDLDSFIEENKSKYI